MEDTEKQRFFKALIKEIHIYEEPVGKQWLKPIKFTFPLLGKSDEINLDNESRVETVVLLSNGEVDSKKVRVEFSLEDMQKSEGTRDPVDRSGSGDSQTTPVSTGKRKGN